MIRAVYPGTFDPFTRGHEDLVRRASRLFGELVLGIAVSRAKHRFQHRRTGWNGARGARGLEQRPVIGFSGLLINFARDNDARVIVRGLRAVSDFSMNSACRNEPQPLPDIETVFLTPSEQHMFISATLVREIAMLGGDVTKFVHPTVQAMLAQRPVWREGGGAGRQR